MSTDRGFFAEMMHRRVPQILGLYIGGVWLCVEIGNWLGEQFTMPERLPAYLFVFLVLLAPSVALVAWIHGAPGKDKTTPFERIFVPANVIIAAAALMAVPPAPVESAPSDQTFVEQAEAEPDSPVALSVRATVFALRNQTSELPDWYSYALPILISEDMLRTSNAFQVGASIESNSIVEQLRRRNFARAMGEPLPVQLELAAKRGIPLIVRGELRDGANESELVADWLLIRVEDGSEVLGGQATFQAENIFAAADQISSELQAFMASELGDDVQDIQDALIGETLTPSLEALEAYTNAITAITLDSDQPALMANLDRAIEADPLFAEALAARARARYLAAQNAPALQDIDAALQADYRLSRASRFRVQITKAMIEQNPTRAINVAKTWVEVQGNNEQAHRRLAEILSVNSLDFDLALRSLERVREINPTATQTLLSSASLERQRGNFDAAVEHVEAYLEEDPESFSARLLLGEIRQAQGDFDGALEQYERAGYLDSQSISPQLGSIQALMQKGDFALAEDLLSRLQQRTLTEQQQLSVLTSSVSLYSLRGQYTAAIQVMADSEELAQRVMNPLVYMLQLQAPMISMRSYVEDDVEGIVAQLDEMRSNVQPPWNTFLYWYDLTPYALYGYPDEYAAAKEMATPFLRSTGNANMQMMLHSADAQESVFNGDFPGALDHVRNALTLTQESLLNVIAASELATIRANLYDLMRQAGEPASAVEGLVTVVNGYPGHAVAHLRLAQAYFAMGEVSKSRASLDRAIEIWSDADATLVYLEEVRELESQLTS